MSDTLTAFTCATCQRRISATKGNTQIVLYSNQPIYNHLRTRCPCGIQIASWQEANEYELAFDLGFITDKSRREAPDEVVRLYRREHPVTYQLTSRHEAEISSLSACLEHLSIETVMDMVESDPPATRPLFWP